MFSKSFLPVDTVWLTRRQSAAVHLSDIPLSGIFHLWRSLPKTKSKNESNNKNSGTLLTEKDGTQYFVMGKVRIKVSEHFAQDGKPLDSLLEDVIQHAAAAS